MSRDGDRHTGLKEIEAGLKGLKTWLDYLEQYHPEGRFWDPARSLRSEIERDLNLISGKEFSWPDLIASAEWLGNKFEEEIDLVKRYMEHGFDGGNGFGR